jgi:hypothetical protein
MQKREVREEPEFTSELKALFRGDTREADEFLRDTTTYLSCLAEDGSQVGGTKVYFKTVPDVRRRRFLVIFYTIDNGTVALHSIKSFSTT